MSQLPVELEKLLSHVWLNHVIKEALHGLMKVLVERVASLGLEVAS